MISISKWLTCQLAKQFLINQPAVLVAHLIQLAVLVAHLIQPAVLVAHLNQSAVPVAHAVVIVVEEED